MRLSTKGRYAVTAMLDLALNGADNPVTLADISNNQGISLSYLEQLFVPLRRKGIVESLRGRSGGYRLARPASDISIAEIMFAVGEPVEMTRCSAIEFGGCVHNSKCLTHDLWRALSNHIVDFLDHVSLQDVLQGIPMDPKVARHSLVRPSPEARAE